MARELRLEGNSWFIRASIPLIIAVLAFAVALAPRQLRAQSGERSGKEVVDAAVSYTHLTLPTN